MKGGTDSRRKISAFWDENISVCGKNLVPFQVKQCCRIFFKSQPYFPNVDRRDNFKLLIALYGDFCQILLTGLNKFNVDILGMEYSLGVIFISACSLLSLATVLSMISLFFHLLGWIQGKLFICIFYPKMWGGSPPFFLPAL